MSEKKKSFFQKANKKGVPENMSAEERAKAADVEEIVSPMRQIVNNFLERKLAVGALVLLILMFITMFVGPLFMPKYSDSYTDVTQQNIPPTMSLAKVPGGMKDDIKMNAKTTPLAPHKAMVGKKMKFAIAVTTAVITMTSTSVLDPYFSSSIGPNNKI